MSLIRKSRALRENVWEDGSSQEAGELERWTQLMLPMVRDAFSTILEGGLSEVLERTPHASPEIEFRFAACHAKQEDGAGPGWDRVPDDDIHVNSSIGGFIADKMIDKLDKAAVCGTLDAFDPVWVNTVDTYYDINAHKPHAAEQKIRHYTAPKLDGDATFESLFKDGRRYCGEHSGALPIQRGAETAGFLQKYSHHRAQKRLSGYTQDTLKALQTHGGYTPPAWAELDEEWMHRWMTANVSAELQLLRAPAKSVAYPTDKVRFKRRRVWRKYIIPPSDPTGLRGAPGWEIAITYVRSGPTLSALDQSMGMVGPGAHDGHYELEVEVLQPMEMLDLFAGGVDQAVRETARFLAWIIILFRQACII